MLTNRSLFVFVLSTNENLSRCAHIFGAGQRSEAGLLALAKALAASPIWIEMTDAVLVVRLAPQPLLGVLGYFDAAAEARLQALQGQVNSALARLRYVSYSQAEADCERLAEQLIDRFGRHELGRFRFIAIPRGGIIVLGMLAYTLGLDHAQLGAAYTLPTDGPVVVVDDCALSGNRFGRFLGDCKMDQIIFAHLYSHPDLRKAIEVQERRVIACLSARDLHDHAPEQYGDDYRDWYQRWRDRSNGHCYWIGQPDHICFAWNEPDIAIWNPVTECQERGWLVVPPEHCLKNRLAPRSQPSRIQVQPEGAGPLKPTAAVLFGDLAGQIVVGNVETERSFSLEGVAADMWRAIIQHGNLEEVTLALLRDYDVDETMLRADLENFVADLIEQGLLTQRHESNLNG